MLIVGASESGVLSKHTYYAFERETGKRLWMLSGSYGKVLAIVDGKLFVSHGLSSTGNTDYEFVSDEIDMKTGKVLKTREYVKRESASEPLVHSSKKLEFDGLHLYAQTSQGVIHRLNLFADTNKTGLVVANTTRQQMRWLAGPYAGRLLLWHDVNQQLTIIITVNLQMLCLVGPRNPVSQLQLSQSGLFVGQTDGDLYALNLTTSQPLFCFATGASGFAPFQVSGRTLLAETENRLYAFDVPQSLRVHPRQTSNYNGWAKIWL